jgi:hypothetical protein
MKISDLIGQELLAVTEPWDDDLDECQIRLVFEDGTLIVSAIDSTGMGNGSIYWEVSE